MIPSFANAAPPSSTSHLQVVQSAVEAGEQLVRLVEEPALVPAEEVSALAQGRDDGGRHRQQQGQGQGQETRLTHPGRDVSRGVAMLQKLLSAETRRFKFGRKKKPSGTPFFSPSPTMLYDSHRRRRRKKLELPDFFFLLAANLTTGFSPAFFFSFFIFLL